MAITMDGNRPPFGPVGTRSRGFELLELALLLKLQLLIGYKFTNELPRRFARATLFAIFAGTTHLFYAPVVQGIE
ncbi:hypothetical protein [Flavilitoribacter nigricans]|uniref:Uncharacterized protein n=1 Tax=Flavilitoribacter nigricans (strain ATCC 23147 / DSM 23189 / NBRC 102662 / NCIMB 1420 / SS-2) TaxID=1122177 RepID=A0A2D0NJ53_FLAN2|nr:hypothetical protein [Flavilitoribacter nigricans]PHN08477.1 hypothetical protein CRP01_00765 [Flavilitoribacter nigricans DSM 23189 = NBRC 102662]